MDRFEQELVWSAISSTASTGCTNESSVTSCQSAAKRAATVWWSPTWSSSARNFPTDFSTMCLRISLNATCWSWWALLWPCSHSPCSFSGKFPPLVTIIPTLLVTGDHGIILPNFHLCVCCRVSQKCPRLVINRDKVGSRDRSDSGSDSDTDADLEQMFGSCDLSFNSDDNYRDVFHACNCDDGCKQLADLLGWRDDLEQHVQQQHELLEKHPAKPYTAPKPVKSD